MRSVTADESMHLLCSFDTSIRRAIGFAQLSRLWIVAVGKDDIRLSPVFLHNRTNFVIPVRIVVAVMVEKSCRMGCLLWQQYSWSILPWIFLSRDKCEMR